MCRQECLYIEPDVDFFKLLVCEWRIGFHLHSSIDNGLDHLHAERSEFCPGHREVPLVLRLRELLLLGIVPELPARAHGLDQDCRGGVEGFVLLFLPILLD